MKRLRKISAIFMALMLLLATSVSVCAATKVQDGIEVTLNTNLQSYDKGEEIVTAITVKNTNAFTVTDVDLSCIAPSGYAITDSVGASSIPLLGANETTTLTVTLTPITGALTGDSSNMVLWGVLLVLALAGAVTLGIVYRKRWKGMLCLVLCTAMLVSLLPANTMQVSATDESGTETQSTVYPEFVNNRITVEAEDCTLSDAYFKVDAESIEEHALWYEDVAVPTASGNAAIHATKNDTITGYTTDASSITIPGLTYTFRAPEKGTYYIWVRALAKSGNGDSVWVALDSGEYKEISLKKDAEGIEAYGVYAWYKVSTGEVEAGTHTIKIHARKQFVYVDKLLISDSADLVPTGNGEYVEPTEPTEPSEPEYPEFEHNRITVEAEDCINNTDMYFVVDDESIVDCEYTLRSGSYYDTNIGLDEIVAQASGNAAIHSTGSSLATSKVDIPLTPGLSYTFNAPEETEYHVWVRVLTKSGDGNGIWFDMDGGDYAECGEYGSKLESNYGTYAWFKLYGDTLSAGEHTINISARKQYIYIDKLLISNDASVVPTGDGEYEEPIGDNYPAFKHNRITVEAEDCAIASPYFVVNSDSIKEHSLFNEDVAVSTASGSVAIHCDENGGSTTDSSTITAPALTYEFYAPEAGEYSVWIRVLAKDGNGDSIWAGMDNEDYAELNLDSAEGSYKWIEVKTSTLTKGVHTIKLFPRKTHVYVDKLLISNDTSLTPTGDGEYVYPSFVNDRITVEAEQCNFVAPYVEVNADNTGDYDYTTDKTLSTMIAEQASGETVLACVRNGNITTSSEITAPALTYEFKAPKESKYYVWVRVLALAGDGDSIWSAMDDGDYKQTDFSVDAENFVWYRVSADSLKEGVHTIKLFPRERKVYVDKLLITTKASLVPSGDGEYVEGAEETSPYSTPTISPTTGEHPRVWFTEGDISIILTNAEHEENSAAWANHLKYRDVDVDGTLESSSSTNYKAYYLTVAKSCAFDYAIRGKAANDDKYGKKAITIMENFLDTLVFKSTGDYHEASEVIYAIGLVYDWCYELLTPEQKENFIEQGLYISGAFTEIGWPPTNQNGWGSHGAEDQLIRNLLAFGIAVYDEKPYVYDVVVGRLQDDYLSQRRDLFYNAHKTLYGNSYGPYRFNADISALFMLSKFYPEGSPNKNFWQNDEMQYVPYWYIYATKPDSFELVEGDSMTYNIADPKSTGTKSPDYMYAMLGSWYKDGYLKYMFLEEREDMEPSQYIEFLICNDPTVTPISKENLPLSKYFDYPAGQYIARTGWDMGKDSDDVVVSMSVNEVTIKDHNHLDAGEFEIYYKGNLATDTGYYQTTKTEGMNSYFASDYWHNYYHQTIAHNCMLVLDPDEPITNFIHNGTYKEIVNTGGQISTSKQGTTEYPETAENFEENEDFNTGKVLGHEVDPYDEMKPDYTYLKGDLTGAYSEKVENYERSFMFLNLTTTDEESDVPAILVVFDHVVSSDASFKKTYLLHGINAPEISGTRTILKRTEEGYNGKLVNDTLLPKADNVTITQVGTNENDYVVGDKIFSTTGADVGVNEGGGIRTEISPITLSTEDYFLNVMQMSDADSTEEPLTATLIEADTHTGVVIADRVVMFGNTNERVADTVTFSFGEEESTELSASAESNERLEASSASSEKGIFSWLGDLFLVVKASDNIGANKISVSETVTVAGKQVKVEGVVTYNLPGDNEEAEDDADPETTAPDGSSETSESTESSESMESSESTEASESTESTESTEPEEEALYQITVADLKAGTWSYTNEDGSARGNVVVTADGGVAAFEGPKGTYTLTYVNESTDRNITQPTYEIEEMPVRVRFNKYYLYSEKELFIENDEVLIPVDTICDALGATTVWDTATNTLTASRYDRTVSIAAGSNTATVNGAAKELSVKARMVDDTLFVPLTFVAEAFLAKVEWIAYTKTAVVTDNVKPPVEGFISVVDCWWDAGIIMGDSTNGFDTLDGNTSTYWATGAAEEGVRYIAYDFGETKNVEAIEILWGNPHLRYFTFDVLVSNDGINWTILEGYEKITSKLVEESAKDEYQTVTLPEGTQARYIKLNGYGNTKPDGTGTYANNIKEIRFK